jgi:histidine triad (HIT) family protein
LDIHPCAPGHTVVIPKKHADTSREASVEDRAAVMEAIMAVSATLQEKLGCAGFNNGWNEGRAAGQAVPHWHVHVIPRDVADGGGSMHSIIRASSNGPTVEEVAKKVIGQ